MRHLGARKPRHCERTQVARPYCIVVIARLGGLAMRQNHATVARNALPARIWPDARRGARDLFPTNPTRIEQIRTSPNAQNTQNIQHTQTAARELARLDGPTRPPRPIPCHSTPKTRPRLTKTHPNLTKPDQTRPPGSHDLLQNTGIPPCSAPERTLRRSKSGIWRRIAALSSANQCQPPLPRLESDRRHR